VWPSVQQHQYPGSYAPGHLFRVEKIANGWLIQLAKFEGGAYEKHFAEGAKEAGEIITAALVRWQLEGSK
jgi:hypothetical protein